MKPFEDEYYERGEAVLHKLTGWLGIVTGERNQGTLYDVSFIHKEINGGLPFSVCVDGVLLEPFSDGDTSGGGETVSDSNVIPVDFTRKVRMTKKTPTQGAA